MKTWMGGRAGWMVCAALALLSTFAGSVGAAPVAPAKGSIRGHVYLKDPAAPSQDPLMDPISPLEPAMGALVFLERSDGQPFQKGTITDATGAYFFANVPANVTYAVTCPGVSIPVCPHVMVLNPPPATGGPRTLLPTGLLLQPGTTADVDLKAPPSCASASPAFILYIDENIVVGGILTLRTDTEPLAYHPAFYRASDSLSTAYDPPYFGVPSTIHPKMEYLDDPIPHRIVTSVAVEESVWKFPDDALADGTRVRVFLDPAELEGLGYRATSPTSYELTYHVGNPIALEAAGGSFRAIEFQIIPIVTVEGRVFADQGDPDEIFNGTDTGLQGVQVAIWDQLRSAPSDPPLATAVSGADGLFHFPGMPPGFYRLLVLTPPVTGNLYFAHVEPEELAPPPPTVEIAYLPDDAPHVPSAVGDLHLVVLDVKMPSGPPIALADVVAVLWDAPESSQNDDVAAGSVAVPYAGDLVGGGTVITVHSVTYSGGANHLQMSLIAQGEAFPGRFFGTGARRLEVFVSGADASFCVPLRCEDLQIGTVVAQSADFGPGNGTLTVLDSWTYDSWSDSHPVGPATPESATALPALHSVDLTIPVTVTAGAPNFVFADVAAGAQPFDAVFAVFSGLPFVDGAEGFGGLANILGVDQTSPGHWVVRLRLDAGLRDDGNPAALAEVVHHISLYANDAALLIHVDLTVPPTIGPHGSYGITAFQNVLDAATTP